jgi:hypothetical protein
MTFFNALTIAPACRLATWAVASAEVMEGQVVARSGSPPR